jgi:hypothetical protein
LSVVDIINGQTDRQKTNRVKYPTSFVVKEKSVEDETGTSVAAKIFEAYINLGKMPLWRTSLAKKNKGRTEPLMQKVRHFSPILSNSGFTRHVITEAPKASLRKSVQREQH